MKRRNFLLGFVSMPALAVPFVVKQYADGGVIYALRPATNNHGIGAYHRKGQTVTLMGPNGKTFFAGDLVPGESYTIDFNKRTIQRTRPNAKTRAA